MLLRMSWISSQDLERSNLWLLTAQKQAETGTALMFCLIHGLIAECIYCTTASVAHRTS